MSDRGEGGLYRSAGADALAMSGGEVEGLLRILFGLSLPNVVDLGFGP